MERIKQKMRKYGKWILVILFLVIFFEMIEDIFQNEIHNFDNTIYYLVEKTIHYPVTEIMKIITVLGSAIPILTICIVSFVLFKNKVYGKYISLNLFVIVLLNQTMKHVFQRPRPTQFRLIDESGYSFPSGHSMVSMAFYGFLLYLVWKKVKNPYAKWGICSLLSLLIFFIGYSRIYLGVHYASDVMGGFCFSLAYLIVYTTFVKKKIEKEMK